MPVLLYPAIWLLCHTLHAQQPAFIQYTVNDGLPSMEVYKVFEDSKGLMWFCTDVGVCSYNGYRFRHFTSEQGLPDNTVMNIREDHRGRIWFYTITSQLFYIENDSVHTIAANKWIFNNIGVGVISSFTITVNDTIYCGVNFGKGIIKIVPPYSEKDVSWIPYETKSDFFVYDVGTETPVVGFGALYKINTSKLYRNTIRFYKHNQPDQIIELPDSINHTHIRACKIAPDHYFIATVKAAAEIKNKSLVQYQPLPSYCSCLCIDKSRNGWLGIYEHGVYSQFCGKKSIPVIPDFLSPSTITDVCIDQSQGLWFSTLANGVYYIPSPAYKAYTGHQQNENSFPRAFSYVGDTSFSASVSGKELIITHRGKDGNYSNEIIPSPVTILDILAISPDTLIIASTRSQMLVLGKTPRFYPIHESKKSEFYAYSISYYNKKAYLVNGSAIFKVNPATQLVEELIWTPTRTNKIVIDSNGILWAGCINGLWKYEQGKWDYHGQKDPLLKNRIDDLEFDTSGHLWMATKGGGVLIYDREKATAITTAHGLSSMICHDIFMAGHDSVIVATQNGISIISKAGKQWIVKRFGKDSGLPQTKVLRVRKKGTLIWGMSHNGLFSFEAGEASRYTSVPRLYFEQIIINNKPIKMQSGTTALSANENTITIHFFGLNYRNPGNLTYYYRLTGLSSNWSRTNSTSVQFISLPPGNYSFELMAENTDGQRSLEKIRFNFHIAAPFWRTGWFISICILLTVVSILLLIKLRISKINTQNQINRRIITSEMTALRAQMNPHFVFNAINSIQHYILRDDTSSAHKSLTKFSKLIRNVLDNSKQETITLEKETETIRLYLELESLRFSEGFEYSIQIDEGIDPQITFIAPMLIQPFAENAIWHGLLHKRDGAGKLIIRVERVEDLLRIYIDDNGIGRKAAEEIRQLSPRQHKPVGVNNTLERIELIRLQYNKNISATIIDKTHDDGTPAGTTVILQIPELH
ncbi:MAG: histidine kinase [Bacteroidetes bacterium]|nr:histidine kinase [Bacteroidota bacterium]